MCDAAYALLVSQFTTRSTTEAEALRAVDEILLPERQRIARQNARGMKSLMSFGEAR